MPKRGRHAEGVVANSRWEASGFMLAHPPEPAPHIVSAPERAAVVRYFVVMSFGRRGEDRRPLPGRVGERVGPVGARA